MTLIASDTRKGTAFLQAEIHGRIVKVLRTASGATLNDFWTVWLRQLVLAAGLERGLEPQVTLYGQSVSVSTNKSQEDTLAFIAEVARGIKPMDGPPIERTPDSMQRGRSIRWYITRDFQGVVDCLQDVKLPVSALTQVFCSYDDVVLQRHRDHPLKLSQLALYVEWHVAKHFDTRPQLQQGA